MKAIVVFMALALAVKEVEVKEEEVKEEEDLGWFLNPLVERPEEGELYFAMLQEALEAEGVLVAEVVEGAEPAAEGELQQVEAEDEGVLVAEVVEGVDPAADTARVAPSPLLRIIF